VSDNDLREIVGLSDNVAQVMNKLKLGRSAYTRTRIVKRINDLSISIAHFKPGHSNNRKSKIDMVPEEKFRQIVKDSTSLTDVGEKCGYTYHSLSSDALRSKFHQRIELLGIDTSHFIKCSYFKKKRLKIDEIFVENGTTSTWYIKRRLLKDLQWPYKCRKCQNADYVECEGVLLWKNEPLTLQLEHINGIHTDHRLENLEFLCPNCHSQTSTFTGKNSKKVRAMNSWIEENYTDPSSSSS
jgi:hypothetical protein